VGRSRFTAGENTLGRLRRPQPDLHPSLTPSSSVIAEQQRDRQVVTQLIGPADPAS
jgi:hypothetical protein